MSLLEFKQVGFEVKGKHIVKDVFFAVHQGDYISVVGPSGSGKSTVLKLASDLISPTTGEILFEETPIQNIDPVTYRRAVGYCFQRPYLFARTVRRNIYFPFDLRGEKPDENRIKELFELVEMPISYMDRANTELSGGEMQRICLIRSLIFKPQVLLLDEVTSALDPHNTDVVERAIENLHTQGITIVSITHNEEQSKRIANRRITIIDGSIANEEVL